MIEIQLFDVVYFLLSNLYFYTYFHLSPLLDHHFFGLWRGETAQYLSWKIGCAKKRKGQYHMWYEIFPLLCGHFPTQKVYIPHSLTSQKCWCLNKKSYKEEMLSSFSTFSYNLTTEILAFYIGAKYFFSSRGEKTQIFCTLLNFQPIEWQHLQSRLQGCAVIGWKMRRRQLEFRCTAVRL